jgi:Undecaprenyl-phosphate glucose phosphotransferase
VVASPESIARPSVAEHTPKRVRFGNVEPAALAVLKALDPLLVVITLALAALICRVPLTAPFGALSLVAFLISGCLIGKSKRDAELTDAPAWTAFPRIVLEWTAVVCTLLFAGFAFKVSATFSRQMILTWFAATPFSLMGAHELRRKARWAISNSAYAARYIIVGANRLGFELSRRLPRQGFMGFFDFRSADRVSHVIDSSQLLGHCRDVATFVRTQGVTSIYIALPLSNVPRISEMIEELRDTTASVYFIPDVFAFDLIQGRLVEINGMAALSVCDTPFYGMDAVMKRVTDLVIASFALLLLWPLMLLIAIGVRMSSRGPVLFRQRRYGLNGEEIIVYKFRSMTVCEDGAVVQQATKLDQRVTPLGRILRSSSLDELPQLFNVIAGTMSVVGPRPHAISHNELYRKLIKGYMIRHKVRPGITGLAQIKGLRGETETVDKMRERVRHDLEYLSHWSPWLDVKIIFKTLWVVARDPNAY